MDHRISLIHKEEAEERWVGNETYNGTDERRVAVFGGGSRVGYLGGRMCGCGP